MSSALYDQNGKVISVGQGLRKVGEFSFTKKYWSFFWTLVPLSSTSWVDGKINKAVKEHNGAGVANLKIESAGCKYNGPLIIGFIPFIPGCINTTISGEIVK